MSISKCRVAAEYTARDGDCLILPFQNKGKRLFSTSSLKKLGVTPATPALKEGATRTAFAGKIGGKRLLALSVRLDRKHCSAESAMQQALSAALKAARKEECSRVVLLADRCPAPLLSAAHEGVILGSYRFDRFLTQKKAPFPFLVVAGAQAGTSLRNGFKQRQHLYDCVNFSRDLANEPPNHLDPPAMARKLRTMGKNSGLTVEVWNERRLKKERCGGVLGVGNGADGKPRMVIGRYTPAKSRGHLCLVGKGITFDSGGYGLKPASYQVGMKYDMSGAATTFSAACAIARLKLPVRVTVITPLAENAVSGEAMQTGSILTTRSGRTVEVEHTDAEGRLILADALTIAAEMKPDWIIDAATLTGAAVVALGEDIAAVLGTDSNFTSQLIKAGTSEGERFWELPLHMPYEEKLKATIADCKNIGGKYGGTILAAVFLKGWVPDGTKWIHCDIAGPGVKEQPLEHRGKGSKGFAVKTITALASTLGSK